MPSSSKLNLDEVIMTEVMTPRSVLNSMMKDPMNQQKINGIKLGEVLTVQHDYGSFVMQFEDVQDYLALRRLRGEV